MPISLALSRRLTLAAALMLPAAPVAAKEHLGSLDVFEIANEQSVSVCFYMRPDIGRLCLRDDHPAQEAMMEGLFHAFRDGLTCQVSYRQRAGYGEITGLTCRAR